MSNAVTLARIRAGERAHLKVVPKPERVEPEFDPYYTRKSIETSYTGFIWCSAGIAAISWFSLWVEIGKSIVGMIFAAAWWP